jgi:multiple sugar transport system permease protein
MLYALYMSVHRWRIVKGPFIGLANYQRIFGEPFPAALLAGAVALFALSGFRRIASRLLRLLLRLSGLGFFIWSLSLMASLGDRSFVDSFRITIWYSMGTVPVQLAAGLLVAFALESIGKGKQPFRVIFLLPYIVPVVSGAAIFERLFSLRPESFANQLLAQFGAPPQQWLGEAKGIFTLLFKLPAAEGLPPIPDFLYQWLQGPSLALISIMFFNYWVFIGYYALIFANGLSQIPRELHEAAEVDGAGAFQRLRLIVIPLLSPTTYFLTLLGIIGTFKSFSHIYVLANPSAQGSVDAMSVFIFNTFYQRQQFSIAAAQSVFLLLIVIFLTVWQQRGQGQRVHYNE